MPSGSIDVLISSSPRRPRAVLWLPPATCRPAIRPVSTAKQDEQTDWEAILERDPGAFIRATGETWLYPAALEPSTKGPVAEVRCRAVPAAR